MTTFTIGEVAERSGFSASALRYYERHGLLEPVARTEADYRLYDESSLARLQFIRRAKELGCSLEEIGELAELWESGDCGPVQSRLHDLVTDKIAESRRRSADLVQFTSQLQTAAAHLGGDPTDGPCHVECACVLDAGPDAGGTAESGPVVLGRADPIIACTLPADRMPDRIDDWQRILDHAVARQGRDGDGVRVIFDASVPIDEVARLVAAEQGCCSFFAFTLTVDQRGVALEIRAPDDAADLVAAVFGTPDPRMSAVHENDPA